MYVKKKVKIIIIKSVKARDNILYILNELLNKKKQSKMKKKEQQSVVNNHQQQQHTTIIYIYKKVNNIIITCPKPAFLHTFID